VWKEQSQYSRALETFPSRIDGSDESTGTKHVGGALRHFLFPWSRKKLERGVSFNFLNSFSPDRPHVLGMVMVLYQHATSVLTLWQQQKIGAEQASRQASNFFDADPADPFDGYSCHVQMHGHKTGKKLGRLALDKTVLKVNMLK
jgi:hypothetical protein